MRMSPRGTGFPKLGRHHLCSVVAGPVAPAMAGSWNQTVLPIEYAYRFDGSGATHFKIRGNADFGSPLAFRSERPNLDIDPLGVGYDRLFCGIDLERTSRKKGGGSKPMSGAPHPKPWTFPPGNRKSGIHSGLFDPICSQKRGVNPDTLEAVITLAVEIAREGREGRKVGTLFVVSDSEEVLKRSRPLILDPLHGHPKSLKSIRDPDMRETVKELAQLDGAFIVSDDGIVLSACRYINASAEGISLPLGLGSRHMAAASITHQTSAVAVVVSESSIVRVFDDGELISEILPEIWLFSRFSLHLTGPISEDSEADVMVVSKKES